MLNPPLLAATLALLVSTSSQVISFMHDSHRISQLYEYFLTLPTEKRLIWPCRFSAVKVLFIVNRYLPFANTVGILFSSSMLRSVPNRSDERNTAVSFADNNHGVSYGLLFLSVIYLLQLLTETSNQLCRRLFIGFGSTYLRDVYFWDYILTSFSQTLFISTTSPLKVSIFFDHRNAFHYIMIQLFFM